MTLQNGEGGIKAQQTEHRLTKVMSKCVWVKGMITQTQQAILGSLRPQSLPTIRVKEKDWRKIIQHLSKTGSLCNFWSIWLLMDHVIYSFVSWWQFQCCDRDDGSAVKLKFTYGRFHVPGHNKDTADLFTFHAKAFTMSPGMSVSIQSLSSGSWISLLDANSW